MVTIILREMGMRQNDVSIEEKSITKFIDFLNGELELNFGRKVLKPDIEIDKSSKGKNRCRLFFIDPLIDYKGQSFAKKAQDYLRELKVDISKISASAEILSALSSIRRSIDYDDASMIDDSTMELLNPEVVVSHDTYFTMSSVTKVSVIPEETFYGLFESYAYKSDFKNLIDDYKRRTIKSCLFAYRGGTEPVWRAIASSVHNTRKDASEKVAAYRYNHTKSRLKSNYRLFFVIKKCNMKGELILSTEDFYNPDLWDEFPSEKVIKECIKIYNRQIIKGGRK